MSSLVQDLRYGIRILRSHPGFAVVSILTLALGIGANTAIFSVVNGLLLRPLPLEEPDRLVLVRDTQPGSGSAPASFPEYLDWRERAPTFQELGAYFSTTFSLTGAGEPVQLPAMRVSANLLPMLGLAPLVGRGFRLEEEKPGGELVAMISQALWKRRFGGSRSVLGTKIVLAGKPYTLVGVLPPGFPLGSHPDVCIPLLLDAKNAPRGLHFITVVGRLRRGPDLARARSEIETLAARLRADGATRHGIEIVPLQESVVGDTRSALLVLLGAV
ncbi:MAG TPA: ABC transporter permease, partial [Candidatus Polarisedimenticolia bacterium]|nr:ABC transporter permease [Candidatus Polarisedimenticolia bacterium]